MIKTINIRDSVYTILVLITYSIFFQQVFVVNIGGSFKIYELLALVLVPLYMFNNKFIIYSKYSLLLFLFFIISPILGSITSYFNYNDYFNFYNIYPKMNNSLRYNMYIIPFIIYLYYIFTWTFFNYIMFLKLNILELNKIIRIYLFSSLLISFYALYGFIFVYHLGFPDIVPTFLDYRNNAPSWQWRPSGFSSEAGDLCYMLSWSVIILIFKKDIFPPLKSKIYLIVIGSVFLLTASSMIVLFFISLFIWSLFYASSLSKKLLYILGIIIIVISMILLSIYFDIYNLLEYYAYVKFQHVANPQDHIGSSAGIRGYQWQVGMKLWLDNLLFGVGGGNSYFHMWRVDMLGVAELDSPKNIYIKVLSELGLFGFSILALFFTIVFRFLYKIKYMKNAYANILYVGLLNTILSYNALTSTYTIWLWLNIAIILSYLTAKYRLIRKQNA